MATASISTIGRAVQDRLPEGKMTWKKMMRPAGEKFTPDNQVGYFKVAPYSFLSARALISKISLWRKLSTPRQSRARDHAVKCRQTWRPNFYNLFIENFAWIGSGFKTFAG